MTDRTGATSLTGGVALLERALSYTLGSLLAVTDAALTRPTPCADWTLRDLLQHMAESLTALREGAAGVIDLPAAGQSTAIEPPVHRAKAPDGLEALRNIDPPGNADTLSHDPESRCRGRWGGPVSAHLLVPLRSQACDLLGDWTHHFGETPVLIGGVPTAGRIVVVTGAIEIAVHGWDVARACGVDRPIPAALAEEMLEFAPILIADSDRPGRFARPLAVSPLAAPGDRLVAFLGRHPA